MLDTVVEQHTAAKATTTPATAGEGGSVHCVTRALNEVKQQGTWHQQQQHPVVPSSPALQSVLLLKPAPANLFCVETGSSSRECHTMHPTSEMST